MKCIRALFYGKVQGVGFRETIRRYALHYGIKGYVKNRADGSVEVIAQSMPEALEEFFSSLQDRPRGARIKECVISDYASIETFPNFGIRHESP